MSLSTTNPKTKNLGGSFNRYQLNRFWGNFNEDLYNRICEIKMQEIWNTIGKLETAK
jgi:hypothetical protein